VTIGKFGGGETTGEGGELTVFVVVTHLGLDTVAEAFAGALNGLFGDLGVLELGTLEGGTTVDGVLGLDVGAGRLLAAHFLAVGTGLESLAVLALDAVDGGVVVVVVTVNLDERLGVLLTLWLLELRLGLVLGAGWEGKRRENVSRGRCLDDEVGGRKCPRPGRQSSGVEEVG
jgi:hypothetical protein